MINDRELMIGVLCGCFLIGVYLSPKLVNAVMDGIHEFQNQIYSPAQRSPHRLEPFTPPRWIAGIGGLLVTLTVLAYLL